MKIGFIGGGQIASALAKGFVAAGCATGSELQVLDRFPASAERFSSLTGAKVASSTKELLKNSGIIFLCVKPNDVASALPPELRGLLPGKLLISVAAGIPLSFLAELAGSECEVCRSMPNTAAEIALSCTAVCFTPNTTSEHKEATTRLFSSVGEVFDLPEKHFDAVVGVGGSGPAYACLLIEAMADGGVQAGLPRETALRMAALAVRGAAGLVLETGAHPAVLREKISSPGGTTIAALNVLEKGAVRHHAASAVIAAAQRSAELSAG